jgi:TonB family protein
VNLGIFNFEMRTERCCVSIIRVSLSRLSCFIVAAIASCAAANVSAENLPKSRPALIGSGPRSLLNLIDAEKLFRKGQRSGWVMFNCTLRSDGTVDRGSHISYRRSAGADPLKAEVWKALAGGARFAPAVDNHEQTLTCFAGTATFSIVNGKPQLRFFANQELEEVNRGSDFVAPQPVQGPAIWAPSTPGHAANLKIRGIVRVLHSMNALGKTTGLQVLSESQPGEGFGEAARATILSSRYLPAYRNGKPTASTLTYDVEFALRDTGWW